MAGLTHMREVCEMSTAMLKRNTLIARGSMIFTDPDTTSALPPFRDIAAGGDVWLLKLMLLF